MPRPVHFEIHAENLERAVEFYTSVFGWESQDWSGMAGGPYVGLITGPDDEAGINGAIMPREGANPIVGGPIGGAVLTIQVDDFDETAARIMQAGGRVAVPKHALAGMAWQGYFHDTESNFFAIHQADPEAT